MASLILLVNSLFGLAVCLGCFKKKEAPQMRTITSTTGNWGSSPTSGGTFVEFDGKDWVKYPVPSTLRWVTEYDDDGALVSYQEPIQ